jgi:hypothetical protein
MKFITFIKGMVTSHSGISSKRVCGVLGWIVAIVVLLYCTVHVIQAPLMILVCCMALLGIDSITGIWKKFDKHDKPNKEIPEE